MIENIEISGVATYAGEKQILSNLKEVNYIYGANGSGKTTISRILNNPTFYPSCNVIWENGNKLPILVYNKDFVDEHFSVSETLKGVFTLGKNSIDLQNSVNQKKLLIETLISEKTALEVCLRGEDNLGGKQKELELLENDCCNTFWNKGMLPCKETFRDCLSGFRSKKNLFKEKIIELSSLLPSNSSDIEELRMRYNQLYAETPILVNTIQLIDTASLNVYEQNIILTKKIIGCEDIDISSMIKKLENSDWVRSGIQYYDKNDGVCPFCQQRAGASLRKSLSDYFDETFEQDITALKLLYEGYKNKAEEIHFSVQTLLESNNKFIYQELLKHKLEVFSRLIQNNLIQIKNKINEPSLSVELESTSSVLMELNTCIKEANDKIIKNNQIVANIETEKKSLTDDVWIYILHLLETDITSYQYNKKNLDKAIDSITQQILQKSKDIACEKTALEELEKKITSVQPTCDQINKLLRSFGFLSFSLQVVENNSYRIVRSDGSLATETLSEGEKNFLTFLYFYNLINGSLTSSGTGINKVVVFDDPISSLDNEVLFIVSSLIRNIINNTNNKFDNIKQIFVLTHNIYFHKEVSFKKKQQKNKRKISFWIIKKRDNHSIINGYGNENPIISSYNALWLEIKADKPNPIALPNSMRRILENYFNTLGGISLDDLEDKFEGEEKNICRSLCSWIHSGSHKCFGDEYYSSLDDSLIIKYKEVFKQIFEYNHQIGHYDMMMEVDDKIEEDKD